MWIAVEIDRIACLPNVRYAPFAVVTIPSIVERELYVGVFYWNVLPVQRQTVDLYILISTIIVKIRLCFHQADSGAQHIVSGEAVISTEREASCSNVEPGLQTVGVGIAKLDVALHEDTPVLERVVVCACSTARLSGRRPFLLVGCQGE